MNKMKVHIVQNFFLDIFCSWLLFIIFVVFEILDVKYIRFSPPPPIFTRKKGHNQKTKIDKQKYNFSDIKIRFI